MVIVGSESSSHCIAGVNREKSWFQVNVMLRCPVFESLYCPDSKGYDAQLQEIGFDTVIGAQSSVVRKRSGYEWLFVFNQLPTC
jgi:hypothetical protein